MLLQRILVAPRRSSRRWAAAVRIATVPAAVLAAVALARLEQPGWFIAVVVVGFGLISVLASLAAFTLGVLAELNDARRDPLTGLPTRAVAERLLTEATASRTPVTVALADVDGLHAVNANLGHAAGDQYLTAVAERLAAAVPAGGRLIRQGGDEFLLIARHISPQALAGALGARLAGPALVGGYRLQPRASIGIADSRGGPARHAVACADAAMYSAKAAGGNVIRVYRPDRDGEPAGDGTRPSLRRRDLGAGDRLPWTPDPADGLLPVLMSADEARLLRHALTEGVPGGHVTRLAGRLDDLLGTSRDRRRETN